MKAYNFKSYKLNNPTKKRANKKSTPKHRDARIASVIYARSTKKRSYKGLILWTAVSLAIAAILAFTGKVEQDSLDQCQQQGHPMEYCQYYLY